MSNLVFAKSCFASVAPPVGFAEPVTLTSILPSASTCAVLVLSPLLIITDIYTPTTFIKYLPHVLCGALAIISKLTFGTILPT